MIPLKPNKVGHCVPRYTQNFPFVPKNINPFNYGKKFGPEPDVCGWGPALISLLSEVDFEINLGPKQKNNLTELKGHLQVTLEINFS